MTEDEMLDAFAEASDLPLPAIEAARADWDRWGPRCRALLHRYVTGQDLSERTERALFVIVHLLGEAEDTASFADLCALGSAPDRFESVLGEDGTVMSYPPILISTFDGRTAPLEALIEDAGADPTARGDGLMVLAYLARSGRIPESTLYRYLSGLPARLPKTPGEFVWSGYARAVAALGFAGLAGTVEHAITSGSIAPDLLNSAEFWADLRDAQQNPGDMTGPIWDGFGPAGSAVERLLAFDGGAEDTLPELEAPPAEPVRNALRGIGRNDPCPCGSGRKYKKCCL